MGARGLLDDHEGDDGYEATKGHKKPTRQQRRMRLAELARLMTPRVWRATALDLAIARIMMAAIALDAIPWSVGLAQEQFSYNVEPEGRGMAYTYPVCGGLVRSFMWGRINVSSYAAAEFALLRLALWLSVLGVATPLSMAASGAMIVRYKIITLGLQISTGHWNDFMGPAVLIMAFFPCGDVLSFDSAVSWARKPGSSIASSASHVLKLFTSAVHNPKIAAVAALQALAHEAKQQPSVCYGMPLTAVALYLGVYILSAGLAKAATGPYYLLSWAFSDHVKGQLHIFWMRNAGEAYVPSLASVGWNPLRLVTNSYLFPILRVDKFPLLLHVGNWVVMVWECLHWYLLLCAPPIRYASVLLDVAFHMSVAMTMGIYQFYHLLATHLVFLPWSSMIAKPLASLLGTLQSRLISNGDTKPALPPYRTSPSNAPDANEGVLAALRRRPRLVLACFVALAFISGQCYELIPRSNGPKLFGMKRLGVGGGHCHPFDPAPGFGIKDAGKLVAWRHNNPKPWDNKFEGPMRTSAREIHFVHSDGDVSSMFLWEAICRMEGKRHCEKRKHGWLHDHVVYNNVCCMQSAPHDRLGVFRDNLVIRCAASAAPVSISCSPPRPPIP